MTLLAYHKQYLEANSIPLSRNAPLKLVHPDLLDPYSFTFDPGIDNICGITGKTRSTDRHLSWYSNHDISSQPATNHGTQTTISHLNLPPIMVLEPRYLLSSCHQSWYSNHDISSQSATNHGTRITISPLNLPPIMVLKPRYLLSACHQSWYSNHDISSQSST